MKKTILFLISFYQNIFSYFIKSIVGVNGVCRHEQTCSQYARVTIEEKGVAKGLPLVLARVFSCQPFVKFNFRKISKDK
jgi:putative component of membrane protein insertase Oxa1/YidC/SpoIIIJ protein YidD